MAKITSPKAELAVLRGLVHKDKKVGGTLLSQIDESYFYHPESIEAYTLIRRHMTTTGSTPTYKLLIEDPQLSVNARKFLRESEATIQTTEDANKAATILNKYRQLRGLYDLAANIDQKLNKEGDARIDVDRLLEETATAINVARSKKSTVDAFLHFGRNNNSSALVKDILYADNSEAIIPTGVEVFDSVSGGFARGALVTIGGGKCQSLDTRIQLSTLVLDLENGRELEVEPEDLLLVKSGYEYKLTRASALNEGDDLVLDVQELLAYSQQLLIDLEQG
jgi:replicative DNA helicase